MISELCAHEKDTNHNTFEIFEADFEQNIFTCYLAIVNEEIAAYSIFIGIKE